MNVRTLKLACAAAALFMGASFGASAQTAVKFALDWKFEGPSAPYFVAIDKGYYKAEGLDVTVDSGPGSVAGIARVAAGAYPLGFFDINSLVKFRDQNPEQKVQAVMMVYDVPPFAIVSLTKGAIKAPRDLEGKVLGAPAPDGAFAQWKAFVKANKIDDAKVKIENVGFPVREPMLAQGKVDAITGFSFSSYFNLLQNNIKAEDISVMLMSDHGIVLYGNAIMVNPEFAKANPKVIKDQWQYQMMTRVLERIGLERVLLVNDGLERDLQRRLSVTPMPGPGDVATRAQRFIDDFAQRRPGARIAVIPEGPYTMLRLA